MNRKQEQNIDFYKRLKDAFEQQKDIAYFKIPSPNLPAQIEFNSFIEKDITPYVSARNAINIIATKIKKEKINVDFPNQFYSYAKQAIGNDSVKQKMEYLFQKEKEVIQSRQSFQGYSLYIESINSELSLPKLTKVFGDRLVLYQSFFKAYEHEITGEAIKLLQVYNDQKKKHHDPLLMKRLDKFIDYRDKASSFKRLNNQLQKISKPFEYKSELVQITDPLEKIRKMSSELQKKQDLQRQIIDLFDKVILNLEKKNSILSSFDLYQKNQSKVSQHFGKLMGKINQTIQRLYTQKTYVHESTTYQPREGITYSYLLQVFDDLWKIIAKGTVYHNRRLSFSDQINLIKKTFQNEFIPETPSYSCNKPQTSLNSNTYHLVVKIQNSANSVPQTQKEISELKDKLGKQQIKTFNLQKQLDKAFIENQNLLKKNKLELDVTKSLQKNKITEQELKTLQEKYRNQQTNLYEAKLNVNKLEGKLFDMEKSITILEKENQKLNSTLKQKEKQVLQKEQQNSKNTFQIQNYHQSEASLKEQLSTISYHNQQQSDRITLLQKHISKLQKTIKQHEGKEKEIIAIQQGSSKENYQEIIIQKEQLLKEKQKMILDRQKQLNELKDKLNNIEIQLKQTKEITRDLEEHTIKQANDLETLEFLKQKEVVQKQKQFQKCRVELSKSQSQFKQLQKQYIANDKQLSKLTKQKEEMENILEAIKVVRDQLTKQLEISAQQLKTIQVKEAKLQEVVHKNQSKVKELSQQIQKLQDENKNLNEQLSKMSSRFTASTICSDKNVIPYSRILFNQDIFLQDDKSKQILINHIEKYAKGATINRTPLLYKYDPRNKNNFHLYIDDIKNLTLVVKTKHAIIAGFYPGEHKEKELMNKGGLLVSVTNDQSYTLFEKKPGMANSANIRGMTYDQFFAIYGNAQIRIKTGLKTVFSNFGVNNAFYNSRGHKIDVFLNEGDKRQVEFEYMQFYQIIFDEEPKQYLKQIN